MKLEGRHEFRVPRERLWAALVDPSLLARVLPGCEPLEPTGENAWKAAMTVAIGPVKGRFTGNLGLSELDPPESYRMKLDGSGPSGFLRGEGRVALEPTAAGTALIYALDAQVGGRIASVGQRLVESSAKAIAKQGLEGLERELAARTEMEAKIAPADAAIGVQPAQVSSPPPSTSAFALRFLIGLWRELPISWRVAIVGVVVATIALVTFLLIR